MFGIAPTQAWDLALGLVQLHEVSTGPPFKPVKLLLDGIFSVQNFDTKLCGAVICKLSEGMLNPTIHITNENIKQSQDGPLKGITWLNVQVDISDINCQPSDVAIQPTPYH